MNLLRTRVDPLHKKRLSKFFGMSLSNPSLPENIKNLFWMYYIPEEKETFASSYRALQKSVVELLKQNWDELLNGSYEIFKQKGKGTYHRKCDMKNLLHGRGFAWDMTIKDFKEKFL